MTDAISDAAIKRFCKHSCGITRVVDSRVAKVRALLDATIDDWVKKTTLLVLHARRVTVLSKDIVDLFETLGLELQRKGFDPNTKLLARCSAESKAPKLPCGFFPKTAIHQAIRQKGTAYAKAYDAETLRWSQPAIEFLHYNIERYVATKTSKK